MIYVRSGERRKIVWLSIFFAENEIKNRLSSEESFERLFVCDMWIESRARDRPCDNYVMPNRVVEENMANAQMFVQQILICQMDFVTLYFLVRFCCRCKCGFVGAQRHGFVRISADQTVDRESENTINSNSFLSCAKIATLKWNICVFVAPLVWPRVCGERSFCSLLFANVAKNLFMSKVIDWLFCLPHLSLFRRRALYNKEDSADERERASPSA